MAIDGNSYQSGKGVSALYKASPSTLVDGDMDILHTDSAHGVFVAGAAATGAALVGNPVRVGASDGTNAVNVACDSKGALNSGVPVSQWSVTNTAAANGQATATKASAGAGLKNYCTSFSGQIVGDGTGNADFAIINLRDGASGAGTVLASFRIALAAGANAVGTPFQLNGYWVGSAATAMTVEMSAAGAAHTIGIVNATGGVTK